MQGSRGEMILSHFLVFRDRSLVRPHPVRTVLYKAISNIGLDSKLYDCYSMRVGRVMDLMKMGLSADKIKIFGRWRSNIVYQYIK